MRPLSGHGMTYVGEINESLARYEQIKRFALLPTELSIDGGELTPTVKLKRRVLHDKHGDVIESLYATGP